MNSSEDPLEYLRSIAKGYLKRLRALMAEGEDLTEIKGMAKTGNIVLELDLKGDEALRETIAEHGIPVTYLSEETEKVKIGSGKPKYVVVADPIDGTRNFLRGIPFYSFSLALSEVRRKPRLSDVVAGLVMDIPHGESFTAVTGGVEVKAKSVDRPLISLYAYERKVNLKFFRLCRHFGVRELGSIALEICYVAEGRLDAVIDVRGISRAVDIAGAYPILKKAGGLLTDLDGRKLNTELDSLPKLSFIAARSESIKDEILRLIH